MISGTSQPITRVFCEIYEARCFEKNLSHKMILERKNSDKIIFNETKKLIIITKYN